jgi:Fe2+ or Zn2+ uptake regulation protein
MTNKQKIKILTSYQDNQFVHPLTCGNNSNHQNLVPVEENDKVILKCLDCNYIQELSDDFIKVLKELDKNYRKAFEMYKEMIKGKGDLNI